MSMREILVVILVLGALMESTIGVPTSSRNPGTCGCTILEDEFGRLENSQDEFGKLEDYRDDCNTCFVPVYDSFTYKEGFGKVWDCDSKCTCTWAPWKCSNQIQRL